MKHFLILLSLLTTVFARNLWGEPPYRPSGWRPRGSKLELPTRGRIGPLNNKRSEKPDIDNLFQQFQKKRQENYTPSQESQYNGENGQISEIEQQIPERGSDYGPPRPELRPPNNDFHTEGQDFGAQNQEYNVPLENVNPGQPIQPNPDYGVPNPPQEYLPIPENTSPIPSQEYGGPTHTPTYLPNAVPQQEYGVPNQEYGAPDQQFSEPKALPKPRYETPKQIYAPSENFNSKESKETGNELWEQQLPRDEPPKDWQRVDSSLSWYRPQEFPKTRYVWGRESQEHYSKDRIDEEAQRLLEQIRQYRIRNSIRDGKVLPADFDTPDYKKRFNIRNRGKGTRSSNNKPARSQQPYSMYGPPSSVYGHPQYTTPRNEETTYGTTQSPMDITTQIPDLSSENPLDFSSNSNQPDEGSGGPNIAISNAVARQGQYYVLQPNGRLQKVTYQTSTDPRKKGSPIISNLKYEYVSPIKDPIYAYQNGQLVRIN